MKKVTIEITVDEEIDLVGYKLDGTIKQKEMKIKLIMLALILGIGACQINEVKSVNPVVKQNLVRNIPSARVFANLKVMPLGDSQTTGEVNNPKDGYRKKLWQLSGNSISLVGPLGMGDFQPDSMCAHAGARADWFLFPTQSVYIVPTLTKYKPDVIIDWIGTNDLITYKTKTGSTAASWLVYDHANYIKIITQGHSIVPNAQWILVNIPNVPSGFTAYTNQDVADWNNWLLNTAIPSLQAQGINAVSYTHLTLPTNREV